MTFSFRKVVTGHNDQGLAIIKRDEVVTSTERRPGYQATTVWCTARFPVNNDEDKDTNGAPGPKGTRVLMRIGEMQPGEMAESNALMHRTETLDYAVILSGQCDMLLDGGETVRHLKEGDVVIQRGTNHAWLATGPEPVKFLFVLIDAEPARVGDKVLRESLAHGQPKPMPDS
jgi:quercetin dioxygenase-like cupin family protein